VTRRGWASGEVRRFDRDRRQRSDHSRRRRVSSAPRARPRGGTRAARRHRRPTCSRPNTARRQTEHGRGRAPAKRRRTTDRRSVIGHRLLPILAAAVARTTVCGCDGAAVPQRTCTATGLLVAPAGRSTPLVRIDVERPPRRGITSVPPGCGRWRRPSRCRSCPWPGLVPRFTSTTVKCVETAAARHGMPEYAAAAIALVMPGHGGRTGTAGRDARPLPRRPRPTNTNGSPPCSPQLP